VTLDRTVPRPVARFWVAKYILRGEGLLLLYVQNKIFWEQQNLGSTALECPSVATGLTVPSAKFHARAMLLLP